MVQVAFNSFNPAIMQNMQAPAYTQNAQPAAAAKIYAPAHDEVVLTAKKPEEEKKTGKKTCDCRRCSARNCCNRAYCKRPA